MLGKGNKYKPGEPIQDGLSERANIKDGPIRAETGEATQRPKSTTETVKSDRGSFKNRC